MAKKLLIKKPIEDLSLDEANELLGDNAKKRIDHARGALLKMVENGEARISTAKPKAAKPKKEPKPELQHDWFDSHYESRQVYTGTGTGVIQREAKTEGKTYFEIEMRSGKIRAVESSKVRFKAVKDDYRDKYVKEDEIRTQSGAPSIHSGDDLAEALLGSYASELGSIAKENGLKSNYDAWIDRGLNPGMIRMNLSNMLRGKMRRGEAITIYGETDLGAAADKARTRFHQEAERQKALAEKAKSVSKSEAKPKTKKAKA